MELKGFVKHNKAFTFCSFCFLGWIAFLLVLSFVSRRDVIFYDALSQKYKTKYSSQIPLSRYFVEPLAAMSFLLADSYDYLPLFVLSFIALSLIYVALRKKGRLKSEKFHLIMRPVKDFVSFSCLVLGLMALINLTILGIGWAILGFHFVNNSFMMLIQVGIAICVVLQLLKLLQILFHPRFALRSASKKKKTSRNGKNNSKTRKILNRSKKQLVYMLGIALLLTEVNLISVSIVFPTQRLRITRTNDEFLFDFHVHTTMSDGYLSPEERVRWYLDQGISGAAFSDHDNLRGSIIAKKYVEVNHLNFIVITAEEWTDHENDIHMNIFGLNETIVPLESKGLGAPKVMNAEDTIKYVKKHGGYITVNHYNYETNPNGGYGIPYTLEQLRDWGVDGFEIVNGGGLQDGRIRDFCLNESLICMGGSDIHTNYELDTVIKLRLDDPNIFTVDNIFKNLKRNDHEVIAITQRPEKVHVPEFLDDIGPFQKWANYFFNLNLFQVISWIVWSCGGFAIFFTVYRKIKKTELSWFRKKIC